MDQDPDPDEEIDPGLVECVTGTGLDAFPSLQSMLNAGAEAREQAEQAAQCDHEEEQDEQPESVAGKFPEPDPIDAWIAEQLAQSTDNLSVQPEPEPDESEPPVDDYELELDGSEDLEEEEAQADDFFDVEEDEAEEENEFAALLTPDVMAKMFANMRVNGVVI